MKFKILFISAIILISMALSISIFNYFSNPKIAYVRNQELVYGYEGMNDANRKYEAETKGWQVTIDSLEKIFHINLSNYNSTFKDLNEKESEAYKGRLENQQLQLLKLKEAVLKKMEKKDLEITQRVLNQVNNFVKRICLSNYN